MQITVARDALQSANRRLVEALTQQDSLSVLSFYSEDVVFMPPNEPSVFGKAEVEEWFREYFEHFRIAQLVEAERHLTMLDKVAIERWCYQVKLRTVSGGASIRDEGRFLQIWKLDGDKGWQISETIWNSIKPIGAGTSRFMALLKERPSS